MRLFCCSERKNFLVVVYQESSRTTFSCTTDKLRTAPIFCRTIRAANSTTKFSTTSQIHKVLDLASKKCWFFCCCCDYSIALQYTNRKTNLAEENERMHAISCKLVRLKLLPLQLSLSFYRVDRTSSNILPYFCALGATFIRELTCFVIHTLAGEKAPKVRPVSAENY